MQDRRLASSRLAACALALASFVTPARAVPPQAGGALGSANVEFVANIPDVGAIGGRILGKTMYVTTLSGVRIYDVSLGIPVLQGAFALPHVQNEDVDTNGSLLLVAADHGAGARQTLYVFDVKNKNAPLLLSQMAVPAAHTASCVLNCTYVWLGGDGGRVWVVNLTNPSAPKLSGSFSIGGQVHDVQVDAKGLAWISTGSGLWAYTPSKIYPTRPTFVTGTGDLDNDFIIHNSLRPYASAWRPATNWTTPMTPAELILLTEEDYIGPVEPPLGNGNCREDGAFQTAVYRQVGTMRGTYPLDAWNLGKGTLGTLGDKKGTPPVLCSSHYFGFRNNIAAVAWYEQGVRFLDVSKPKAIRQIGYWLPAEGAAWNAQFNGDYVYVFDAVRGLDVLKFNGKPGDKAVMAPHYNVAALTMPSHEWGYACRIPGVPD
ncbi:MAG TPA: hypothetical protein VM600_00470 [Actinomycetota bacterium]|nr:hypothetical protein [Actinomycetota bacterium]